MSFIRRFSTFPSLAKIAEIEGVAIVDLLPPGIFLGLGTGTVCLVGEWPKGPFNAPTEVSGDATIRDNFGGFAISVADPLSFATNRWSNGNAHAWLKGKSFSKLILVRPNLNITSGGVDLTVTGTPTPLTSDLKIPAGTRVRNPAAPTQEFALSDDVIIASGTDLTLVAASAFVSGSRHTTRNVTGVPVYSVQGVTGTINLVTQIDSGDLFRAGIGAGTGLPSIVVAVVNPAVLTVLSSGAIDTAYSNAIDAARPGSDPQDGINIIACARQSQVIRQKLVDHVRDASAVGLGRVGLIRPPIGTNSASARGGSDPGVGLNRTDRIFYCYPHFEQFISDIPSIDPTQTGNILVGADSAMAHILSILNPEENPGQATGLLTYIRSLEPNLTGASMPTNFLASDYVDFKSAGIAALHRDNRIGEWVFQSGVTSVNPTTFPQLAPIKRRRMADHIQDSMAAICLKFNKKLGTIDRKDALVGELFAYLESLLSRNDQKRQRIDSYAIDDQSANTPALSAVGIHIVVVTVRQLGSLDDIVLQTTIGETVEVVARG